MSGFLAGILLAISIALTASMSTMAQEPVPSIKWEPVIGVDVEGFKLYVNKAGIKRAVDEKSDIATGAFLLVPEAGAIQFKNKGGKIVSALSIARFMTIDCKVGTAIPMYDLYFDIKNPGAETKPIGVLDHTKSLPIDMLPKSSVLFRTLCPEYI